MVRGMNTLAAGGLEEPFFPVVLLRQFFLLWREIVLGVITYHTSCGVVSFFLVAAGNSIGLHRSVFWLWREIGLGVAYYLSTIPVVPLCQFFGCGGK
jgi:hypothetical protein